jgi:hypothetical protein
MISNTIKALVKTPAWVLWVAPWVHHSSSTVLSPRILLLLGSVRLGNEEGKKSINVVKPMCKQGCQSWFPSLTQTHHTLLRLLTLAASLTLSGLRSMNGNINTFS